MVRWLKMRVDKGLKADSYGVFQNIRQDRLIRICKSYFVRAGNDVGLENLTFDCKYHSFLYKPLALACSYIKWSNM
jgi:hypothetical protein